MNLDRNNLFLFLFGPDLFPLLLKYRSVLSPEEEKRASSFVFETDRDQFLASHIGLRVVLSSMLKVGPETLKFRNEKWGKPFLQDIHRLCFFNLSRTKYQCAIAVSHSPGIGVDIESTPSIRNWYSILEGYFSEDEYTYIQSLAPNQQEGEFLKCWTKREAFLKGTGEGIGEIDHWKTVSFLPDKFADPRTKDIWNFFHFRSQKNAYVTVAHKQNDDQKEIQFCDIRNCL